MTTERQNHLQLIVTGSLNTTLDFCLRHLMPVAAWNDAYSDAQQPTHEDSCVSEEANTPVTMKSLELISHVLCVLRGGPC